METQELNFGGGKFGGGLFASLRSLLDMKNKLDSLGIDFSQAKDLLPALDAFRNAPSTDAKLTAFQTLVREFSEVTTKTTADDELSAVLDQLLVDPLRGHVVRLLDKALTQTVSEPGLVLSMEAPDEVLVEDLRLRDIDWAKLIETVSKLAALFAAFK
jgi:hypothetical protein